MLLSSEREYSLDDAVRSFELFFEGHQGRALAHIADFLPPIDHPRFAEALVELIRVDMELGWSSGHPTSLDDYLDQFPTLREQREGLSLVCFEEHRQRILAGENVAPSFYREHYGVDTHRAFPEPSSGHSHQLPIDDAKDRSDGLPAVGETFLDFELIRELGRGSFARVFLARQLTLSDRLVALKVTRNRYSDAGTLARLQHSHIIPIYSVQRVGEWEAICMPYFGSVTVRQWLGLIQEQKSVPASAKFVYDTIRDERERTVREFPESAMAGDEGARQSSLNNHSLAPHLQALSGLPYTQSVLLMAKKIACGLAYAHERGIIHRDLKPANLLIADDGEPLILDFNLSQDQSIDALDRQQMIGGTLPYMAPEQLMSLEQCRDFAGDPRSDLYSFGIILYELLVGHPPFPIRSGSVHELVELSLADRRCGPAAMADNSSAITPAIQSIIEKCLAWNVEARYQSAKELADDLDCELNDLPLRTAPNRSLVERGQKWMRRHPRLVSVSGISVMAAALLLLLGSVLVVRSDRLANFEAQTVWQSFQKQLRRAELQLTGSTLADNRKIADAVAACDEALGVYSVGSDPAWLAMSSVKRLDPWQRQQLAQDVAELYFLKATSLGLQANALEPRSTVGSEIAANAKARAQVLLIAQDCNQRASQWMTDGLFGTALERQRRWLRNDRGMSSEASVLDGHRIDQADSEKMSVRMLCERACLLSAQHRFREATAWWDAAALRDPQNLWVWYGLGDALRQTEQYARAAECYSVCTSLDPSDFRWYHDRGVTRMQTGNYELAVTDLRHAAKLNPSDAETRLNLAIALIESHDDSLACEQLEQALKLGLNDPQIYLLLARARTSLGDTEAAERARTLAHRCEPMRAESWVSRGVSKAPTDPRGALLDFDEAIKLNAFIYEAYESKASVHAEILHDNRDAILVLNEAVRLFPESGECRALRGVLHARLQHKDEAIADAESALTISSSPQVGYCVAGIYANLSNASQEFCKKATELLASSLQAGYGEDLLDADSDLAPIRDTPEFKRLRSATAVLRSFTED